MPDTERHDVNESIPDRRQRERRASDSVDAKAVVLKQKTQSMWRRDLVLVAALLIFLFGAERYFDKNARSDAREAIVTGIEKNCEADREFREQYRYRGIAEKQLLELFLSMAQETVKSGIPPEEVPTSKEFLKDFAPLAEKIEVLPLPDCAAERAELEAALAS